MSDSALVTGAIYSPHDSSAESTSSANITQEIIIEPTNPGKETMLASERSLMSLWMTTDEEEAWKDL
jgi:hypothetical protein